MRTVYSGAYFVGRFYFFCLFACSFEFALGWTGHIMADE